MYFSDIWIVGDSLISRADFWASSASRMNLKIDPNQAKVRWLDTGSMKWQHLRLQNSMGWLTWATEDDNSYRGE